MMTRAALSRLGICALLTCFVVLIIGRPTVSLTAELSRSVDIKDLTWLEVRTAVDAGYTTVLVPTGGIEQNGAHMVLGKHDYIVGHAAREIALGLGRTLVAPVVSYVPEGEHEPPTGHMRFAGTLGVTPAVFAGILDGIARSLKAHGFKTIAFVGEHGDSQPVQREVARRLSLEWARVGVRVAHIDAYYDDGAQVRKLEAEGETTATIGQHASIIDTSELLAIHPAGVNLDRVPKQRAMLQASGASGDPSRSSAAKGRALIDIRIKASIAQMKALTTM